MYRDVKKNITCVSTNMPKNIRSVGRKFFLFFVSFLYADFRVKLFLGALSFQKKNCYKTYK